MLNNSLTKTGKAIRNVIILLVLGLGLWLLNTSNPNKTLEIVDENTDQKPISFCFYRKDILGDSVGKYTLRLNLEGERAYGELNFLPAQKDSKIGEFKGTVSSVDPDLMGRRVNAIWDTLAEGMNTKEELKMIFGEGTVSVGFGIHQDRGDGVYMYENPDDIKYTLDMTDVGCEVLDEIEKVEKYIRDNIKSLSPRPSVLGGYWYVVSVNTDYTNNSGTVIYEDGHIKEQRTFTYTYDESNSLQNLVIH